MKLSDYVIDFLVEHGVKHVFMLPGGGAMHLNDSLGKRRHEIEFVCNLHEQACSIAAEAYAKLSNELGVAMVTTGPAGTNSVTGVAGAWLDSMPCLFLSGQVKRADIKAATGLRQLGVQEVDIVSIVQSITKYAVTVLEPESIRFHLEKALHRAKSGRPGPSWVDIPLDVQAANIELKDLKGFVPEPKSVGDPKILSQHVREVIELLSRAERPVIVAGNGIRVAGAVEEFRRAFDAIQAPVLTTWLGMDLLADDHPLFAGRPGAIAPRGANFALQNSDLMLAIGARLDMAFTGYAHDKLARAAVKIVVDVDEAEIRKLKMRIALSVVADAGDFLRELERQLSGKSLPSYGSWLQRCQEWKQRYPIVQKEHRKRESGVSVYYFSEIISDALAAQDVIVSGSSGSAIELFLLVFKVKENQRIFHTRGLGAMGFALPASIGACLAAGRRRTVCVDGDGGFQMNIQELETVRRLQLPIKFFVLNNDGYASIRTSQENYFHHLVAADSSSGLTLPDVLKVARAYNLKTARIERSGNLRAEINAVLEMEGPVVCEVMTPPEEQRAPRLSSAQRADGTMVSKPLEDLWPFLDRQEFRENMLIPTLDE
jgi:acetolactate synthase-1/2/3 large subunit